MLQTGLHSWLRRVSPEGIPQLLRPVVDEVAGLTEERDALKNDIESLCLSSGSRPAAAQQHPSHLVL
ncbi:hypothetical protein HaLaN_15716 [Haematococcus lacustris]|uniref:Uncharacterized protein n=1 Tax=Haematococcus lacustris TaxID=44745 RepID=A0A699ZHC6_HAELA|nr:hypothetical protein HaLaN_15716 [Haematococcus lacustris]